MESVETYLTTKDAAEILQVSFSTMKRWIKNGDIVAIKIGHAKQSTVRIRRSDLDAFAARHRVVTIEESDFGYKRPPAIEGVA